jgi:hypothetical protein
MFSQMREFFRMDNNGLQCRVSDNMIHHDAKAFDQLLRENSNLFLSELQDKYVENQTTPQNPLGKRCALTSMMLELSRLNSNVKVSTSDIPHPVPPGHAVGNLPPGSQYLSWDVTLT